MRLALFDFDGTLTTRDSLLPFLRFTLGNRRFATAMLASTPMLTAYALKQISNDVAKQRLLARTIGGMEMAELQRIGLKFAAEKIERLLRQPMLERLRGHQANGDTCLLVSASLDCYLAPWALTHGFEAVLCSKLAVDPAGQVTGRLQNKNCFGPVKVERISAWLAGREPTHITAYGDSRGDKEMLALANEAHWVRRQSL